jgi:hypothetical protein
VFGAFENMIRNDVFLERAVHRFIHDHARVLLPEHVRCFFEVPLRQGDEVRVADFVLQRDPGTPALLIELENPSSPVLRQNGDPTAQANHAVQQIAGWVRMIDSNSTENASGEMQFLSGPKQRLVIIGRGTDQRARLIDTRFGETLIWTYDILLEEAKRRWRDIINAARAAVRLDRLDLFSRSRPPSDAPHERIEIPVREILRPVPEDRYQGWAELTGVTRQEAEGIARVSDRADYLEFDRSRVRFSLKRFSGESRPRTVLVATEEGPGRPPRLMFAIKVFDDVVGRFPDAPPSELLRHIVERFGCEVALGRANRKFYFNEVVEVVPNEPLLRGATPQVRCHGSRGPDGALGQFLVMLAGTPEVWRCALCFVLDAGSYGEYVRASA